MLGGPSGGSNGTGNGIPEHSDSEEEEEEGGGTTPPPTTVTTTTPFTGTQWWTQQQSTTPAAHPGDFGTVIQRTKVLTGALGILKVFFGVENIGKSVLDLKNIKDEGG